MKDNLILSEKSAVNNNRATASTDNRRQNLTATTPLAVSTYEAARLAGVGRTKIYDALGSGTLKSLKIGKRRLILFESLQKWLLSHEVTR